MSPSTIEQNLESDAVEVESTSIEKPGDRRFIGFSLSACFVVGLLLCWRTNFSHAALDVAPMFDSGKYISSTESVMNATTFIHHFSMQEWRTICSALKEPLMLDGPILPLLGAAWFTLIHKTPDLYDMRAALALQALIHAASACCMFVAARRLLNSSKWALIAGLSWAAYPSAVLGAGRFMTENITSTLLLLMVCFVPKQVSDRYLRSFALGVIATAVVLLKAAFLPGILLGLIVVAISLWSDSKADRGITLKRLILHAVSLGLGTLLILTPWLLFSKEATGTYSITAQREPMLNIVCGGNSEPDGWSSNPETAFVKLFVTQTGDKTATFLGIWQANLPELSNIAIRRITRLWSSPWNDFLSKFMGLTLPVQWLWHQLILYFAILGLLVISFRKSGSPTRLINPILYLSGSILAAHFVYILFISSPRQAFTSMPFFILLAYFAIYRFIRSEKRIRAFGLLAISIPLWFAAVTVDTHSLLQIVRAETLAYLFSWLIYAGAAAMCSCALVTINGDRKTLLPSFCLQVIPAAIICAAFAVTPKSVPEWQCDLIPGLRINRTVSLDTGNKPDWAVLVVDGNYASTKASISINGNILAEPLAPLFTFTSNKDPMINYAVFGGVSNKNPEQLRQWRAVAVPLSFLKPGINQIAIESKSADATIYGSFIRLEDGKLMAPSLWGFSACKLLSETQPKLEARYSESLTASAAKGKCWLTINNVDSANDLSPSIGEQSGQYRAFLCLGFDKTKRNLNTKYAQQKLTLESTPIEISDNQPFSRRYPVPKNLGDATFVNIAVSGNLGGDNALNVLSKVDVRNLTNLGSDLCVPGSVKQIQQPNFELSGDLTRASLNQENEFFEVKLQSKKTILLNKLSLVLTPRERPDFAKAKVAIY